MGAPAEQFKHTFAKNLTSNDVNINGLTPKPFDIEGIHLYRVIFYMLDTNIYPALFGGIAALANGITVKCVEADGTVVVDFLDGGALKCNADFGLLAGADVPVDPGIGNGDDQLIISWDLTHSSGQSLDLTDGRKLRLTVQDDLSSLTALKVIGQGRT